MDVGEAAREGASENARRHRLSEVDRLEENLGVIEDGRLGSDLLVVVREEGLGACAKGAVGGGVGADVSAGPFGEADALLLPVGPDSAGRFDEEEKNPMMFDVDCIVVVAAALLNPALAGGVVEEALALQAAGLAAVDLDVEVFPKP